MNAANETSATEQTPRGGGEEPVTHDIALPETSVQSGTHLNASRETLSVADVTLFVYGWHNVQPGTLSWVFPSADAALVAVRAMRNAIQWVIVRGRALKDLDLARTTGEVLVENTG